MVFGPHGPAGVGPFVLTFNSLWELDDVRTRYPGAVQRTGHGLSIPCGNQMVFGREYCEETHSIYYALSIPCGNQMVFGLTTVTSDYAQEDMKAFNSLWELDGVRTSDSTLYWRCSYSFQFPVGIRWCSDPQYVASVILTPAGGLSIPCGNQMVFGHGWHIHPRGNHHTFNSLWELDGVRTKNAIFLRRFLGGNLSIPCGNQMVFGRTAKVLVLEGLSETFQFPVGIRWCSDSQHSFICRGE